MTPLQTFFAGLSGLYPHMGQFITQGTGTGRFAGDMASALASTQFAPQIAADEARRAQISQLVANIQDPHVRQQALNFLGQNRLDLNTTDNGKGALGVGADAAFAASELIPLFRGVSRFANAANIGGARLFPLSSVQQIANYRGVPGTALNAGNLADRFSFMGNGYETPNWLLKQFNTPTNLTPFSDQAQAQATRFRQQAARLAQQRNEIGQFTNLFK